MGGFFKKSGNGRGVFPDTSVESLKSLFTNDDERNSSCPCAIADGGNTPTPPNSCPVPAPVYQEVTVEDFYKKR